MWPAANSPGSHTSITTAFSRFINITASAGVRPLPCIRVGKSRAAPDVNATRISIQFSVRKLTGFLVQLKKGAPAKEPLRPNSKMSAISLFFHIP